MDASSVAFLRKNASSELAQLAESHLKHDLQQSDRDALKSAASSMSTFTAVGSAVGLGLGLAMAFRIRSLRTKMFEAFKAKEKPTHLKFADGREVAIPDITPMIQPSTLGDVAAYLFFSAGGLFIGGELGLLGGSLSAKRTISKDPDSRKRIETAFKKFRADVLRREIEQLDAETQGLGMLGTW